MRYTLMVEVVVFRGYLLKYKLQVYPTIKFFSDIQGFQFRDIVFAANVKLENVKCGVRKNY